MEQDSKWNSRLEKIKQAFLTGECSYEMAIQKLNSGKLFYSAKCAKDKVDSWMGERLICADRQRREHRLPVLNESFAKQPGSAG